MPVFTIGPISIGIHQVAVGGLRCWYSLFVVIMACRIIIRIILLILYMSVATAGYLKKARLLSDLGYLVSCQERKCPRSMVEFASSWTDQCNVILSSPHLNGGSCWSCQCPVPLHNVSSSDQPISLTSITSMYVTTKKTLPISKFMCSRVCNCIFSCRGREREREGCKERMSKCVWGRCRVGWSAGGVEVEVVVVVRARYRFNYTIIFL